MKKIVIMVVILFVFSISGCTICDYFPTEGVWYCDELGLQISFNHGTSSFVIENGRRRLTGLHILDGSDYIEIYYADSVINSEGTFFRGYCSHWDEDEMLIVELHGRKVQTEGQKYTFTRVG